MTTQKVLVLGLALLLSMHLCSTSKSSFKNPRGWHFVEDSNFIEERDTYRVGFIGKGGIGASIGVDAKASGKVKKGGGKAKIKAEGHVKLAGGGGLGLG